MRISTRFLPRSPFGFPTVLFGALIVVLFAWLGSGCGATVESLDNGSEDKPQQEIADGAPNWSQLPEAPISGRVLPIVAAVDDHLLVVGGWDFLCPPTADCAGPEGPPFADGAVYNFGEGEWELIPNAPIGIGLASTTGVDQHVYLLNWCSSFTACPDEPVAFLRFDLEANEWTELAAPQPGAYELAGFNNGVVGFGTDNSSPVQWFDPGSDSWTELPKNPFPESFDHQVVDGGDRLLMFASATVDGENTKLAASFDPLTARWTELPGSGTTGYQVWPADGLLYLNPHFGPDSEGGVFDPATGQARLANIRRNGGHIGATTGRGWRSTLG